MYTYACVFLNGVSGTWGHSGRAGVRKSTRQVVRLESKSGNCLNRVSGTWALGDGCPKLDSRDSKFCIELYAFFESSFACLGYSGSGAPNSIQKMQSLWSKSMHFLNQVSRILMAFGERGPKVDSKIASLGIEVYYILKRVSGTWAFGDRCPKLDLQSCKLWNRNPSISWVEFWVLRAFGIGATTRLENCKCWYQTPRIFWIEFRVLRALNERRPKLDSRTSPVLESKSMHFWVEFRVCTCLYVSGCAPQT